MRRTRRRFLTNRPSTRTAPRRPHRPPRRLIDLRVAHLALRVGARRQNFVRDAVWNLRTLAVGVLRDALVEPRAKIGQRVGEPLHGVRPERQQPAVGHRFHGRVVREATERRHFAEVLARAKAGDVHAFAAVVAKHTDVAAFDQVHRPGRIARPDNYRARPDVDRLELREHDADDGFRGKSCERRKASEESLELTMLGLQLEIGADIGRALEQTVERRPIEPERQHVAAGAHRRRTSRAVEQFDLPEAVAGAQDVQRNLIAVVRALDHAGPARDKDVPAVGGVAFGHDHAAKGERHGNELANDQRAGVVWEKPQDREIVEDTEFGHAASPPVEVSRARIAQPVGLRDRGMAR
jgi:hypothetical protein